MFDSIAQAVWSHSQSTPHRLAMADGKRSFTYRAAADYAGAAAAFLLDAGLKPGDRVAVECTQDCAFLLLDLACEMAGLVFVPVENRATAERVRDVLEQSEARCLIGGGDAPDGVLTLRPREIEAGLGRYGAVERAYDAAGEAEILFTTGTTGQPKGIVISHRANVAIAENIIHGVEMGAAAVELIPMPLSHSHGLRSCYAHLLNGSTVVIVDGITDLGLFFRLLEEYGANALDLSPTLARLLMKVARRGLERAAERIEYLEIGTANLDDGTREGLKRLFPRARLYNFYGSTEAGRSCVLNFNEYDESGCIGTPAVNARFRIVDGQRRPMESSRDNPGAIAVSGAMMMEGYLNSPQLTASVLEEGVLYTSDVGYMDGAGRLFVLGRADDIINYKGIKIAPEEIEQVAAAFPGVKDCACVPLEDKLCGQAPKLFVSVEEGAALDTGALLVWLKGRLLPSRAPVAVEVLPAIPRSANGKLQRKKLRERETR